MFSSKMNRVYMVTQAHKVRMTNSPPPLRRDAMAREIPHLKPLKAFLALSKDDLRSYTYGLVFSLKVSAWSTKESRMFPFCFCR